MSEVNIATLNINGAREMRKRIGIFEVVKQRKIDVVMMQETHSDVKNAPDWAVEWDGISVLSHNTSLSGGVAILFAKSFSPHSYQVEEIIKGRLLKVRATFDKFTFVFICVYVPTSAVERMLFLKTLCSALQNCSSEEYLFLGSRNLLIQLIRTHELCDVWRQFYDTQRQYTWTHVRDCVISLARLDRIYVFKHHLSVLKRCAITPLSFSDHSMVLCSVLINSIKPRSAYWQFNITLLGDKYFKGVFKLF
jgi:exonuclease III